MCDTAVQFSEYQIWVSLTTQVCSMISGQINLWLTFYELKPEQLSVYWLQYMLDDHEMAYNSWQGHGIFFLFFKALKPALGTKQLPIQWVMGFCFSHSTLTTVWGWAPKCGKAKDTWRYTSLFPYKLTWCLLRYRDFPFT